MILQPQVDFPIVRQIANHLDTATYYVQAVVRDADGTLIAEVNLTAQGSQRFQKRYRVPVDGSGQGAYISIVTSVYTDSGYSTKSANYGDEENTYLIFDRVSASRRGGGGASSGPGLSEIRRVVEEVMDAQEKDEYPEMPVMPEIPEYSKQIDKITANLNAVLMNISKIPTEATDIMPILLGIQNLANSIEDKEVTPETDMEPVLNEVRQMNSMIGKNLDTSNANQEVFREEVKKTIVETMEESVANTEYVHETSVRPKSMPRKQERVQQEQSQRFNIKDLV